MSASQTPADSDSGLYFHHYTPRDQLVLAIWADIIAASGVLAEIHHEQGWTFPQLTMEIVTEALYFCPMIFDDSGSMVSPDDSNLRSAEPRVRQILEVRHKLRKALETVFPEPCDAVSLAYNGVRSSPGAQLFFMNWQPSFRYSKVAHESRGINDSGEHTAYSHRLVIQEPGPRQGSLNPDATRLFRVSASLTSLWRLAEWPAGI
jgi:hypothetical protein